MNPTQIQTTLAPIITAIATFLATKFAIFDGASWSAILSGVIALAATVWGAWAGRNNAVISTAAKLPEVQSVTLSQSAPQSTVDATPSNVNK